MTDYTELVKALRACGSTRCGIRCISCPYNGKGCHVKLCTDAADTINALQAELEKKRTAYCCGCKCEKMEACGRLQKRGKPVLLAALSMNECEKLEPKRGEWIHSAVVEGTTAGGMTITHTYTCSVCGALLGRKGDKYCYNCGSRNEVEKPEPPKEDA